MMHFPEERLIEVVSVLEDNGYQVEVGGGICFGVRPIKEKRRFIPLGYELTPQDYPLIGNTRILESNPKTGEIGVWGFPINCAWIDMEKNYVGFDDDSSPIVRKHQESIRKLLVSYLGLA